MHLSISSSKMTKGRKEWLVTWGIALCLTAVIVILIELFWRRTGHIPTVVDDERLWAIERDKVCHSNSKIVLLLGKSVIQLGFSLETFTSMCPDYQIYQLAISEGSSPVAVLYDLAVNTDYQGIIICEISTEDFLKERWDGQRAYVDYYYNSFNLNEKINRQISTFFQEKFVIMNPNLNAYNLIDNLIINGMLPTPQHVIVDSNRNYYGDFTKFKKNIKNFQLAINKIIESIEMKRFSPKISPMAASYKPPAKNVSFVDKWLFEAKAVLNLAQMINDRGGAVVFVNYPGALKPIDEIRLKQSFWDRLENNTSVQMIHYNDVKSLSQYKCPDGAHLDFRDVPDFTKALINEIIDRNIIRD